MRQSIFLVVHRILNFLQFNTDLLTKFVVTFFIDRLPTALMQDQTPFCLCKKKMYPQFLIFCIISIPTLTHISSEGYMCQGSMTLM